MLPQFTATLSGALYVDKVRVSQRSAREIMAAGVTSARTLPCVGDTLRGIVHNYAYLDTSYGGDRRRWGACMSVGAVVVVDNGGKNLPEIEYDVGAYVELPLYNTLK